MKPRITTSSIWKSAAWRRATLNSLLGRAGSARGAWAVFARPFTEAGPLRRGQHDWLNSNDQAFSENLTGCRIGIIRYARLLMNSPPDSMSPKIANHRKPAATYLAFHDATDL